MELSRNKFRLFIAPARCCLRLFFLGVFSLPVFAQDASDPPIKLLGTEKTLESLILDVSNGAVAILDNAEKKATGQNASTCKKSYQNSLADYGKIGLQLNALNSNSAFLASRNQNQAAVQTFNTKVKSLSAEVRGLEEIHQRASATDDCPQQLLQLGDKKDGLIDKLQGVNESLKAVEKLDRNGLNLK